MIDPEPASDAPPPRGEVLASSLFGLSAGVFVFVARALWVAASDVDSAPKDAAAKAFMVFWGPVIYVIAAGSGALMGAATGLFVGIAAGLVVRTVRQARPAEAWTAKARQAALVWAGVAIVASLCGLVRVVPGLFGSEF